MKGDWREKGEMLVRACWKEIRIKAREGKEGSGWEEERGRFFESRGINRRESDKEWEGDEEEGWFGEVIKIRENRRKEERR